MDNNKIKQLIYQFLRRHHKQNKKRSVKYYIIDVKLKNDCISIQYTYNYLSYILHLIFRLKWNIHEVFINFYENEKYFIVEDSHYFLYDIKDFFKKHDINYRLHVKYYLFYVNILPDKVYHISDNIFLLKKKMDIVYANVYNKILLRESSNNFIYIFFTQYNYSLSVVDIFKFDVCVEQYNLQYFINNQTIDEKNLKYLMDNIKYIVYAIGNMEHLMFDGIDDNIKIEYYKELLLCKIRNNRHSNK